MCPPATLSNPAVRRALLSRLANCVFSAVGALALPGCLAMVVVASQMGPSPRSEFEARADGRLYSQYGDACYWKSQFDPARSLCGRLIETRETPKGVEYVHGPYDKCEYSFLVDKDTNLITSWRYVSAPESCWIRTAAE
jgi:hypothetical protein